LDFTSNIPINKKGKKVSIFNLHQNYPNPFNSSTIISWQSLVGSRVQLKIYNLLGQEVRTLVEDWQEPGTNSVVWDGCNNEGIPVVSGIYFYKLMSGNYLKINKMMLSR
jgi:flagellar hook assembly protein FlgD